jgi:hypothetical protein
MIIRPVARALSSRTIDKALIPTDYFKTSLANLVFCSCVSFRHKFTGWNAHALKGIADVSG